MADEETVRGLLLRYSRTWLLVNLFLVALIAGFVSISLLVDTLANGPTGGDFGTSLVYLVGPILLAGVSVLAIGGMFRRTRWMYLALFLQFALFIVLSAALLISQNMNLLTGIPLIVELDVLIGVARKLVSPGLVEA